MRYIIDLEEDYSYSEYIRPDDWPGSYESNDFTYSYNSVTRNIHLRDSGFGYDRRIRLMEVITDSGLNIAET